jgi:hypothetical protein
MVGEFLRSREPAVRTALCEWMAPRARLLEEDCIRSLNSLERREKGIAAAAPSAAQQLVQAGLFDQRAIRAHAARSRSAGTLLDATEEQARLLVSSGTLTATCDLSAVLFAPVHLVR